MLYCCHRVATQLQITNISISYVHWTVYHGDSWRIKTNLMSLAILCHFLCAQHVLDFNISIIWGLRLFCLITTVVLFLVRCVLEFRCGWLKWYPYCRLKMMDILMSETCWAHKKLNKIGSDIKLVFYSSNIYIYLFTVSVRTTTSEHIPPPTTGTNP